MSEHTDDWYGYRKSQIDHALEGYFTDTGDGADGLREAMRYSLLAPGKRIRPILCLEFCELCDGDPFRSLPVACGIEMLHAYSLIHDDLPCMDDDAERRGLPTNHKKYGETTAVLAGDCLQAEAFRAVCDAQIGEVERARCCRLLSQAAGISGICGGQFMDLKGPGSEKDLLATDMGKTASLMAAACAMGAASAGAAEGVVDAAAAYGRALGLAFQCRDDMLDQDGFYVLLGAEGCEDLIRKYTEQALDLLERFPGSEHLRQLTLDLSGRQG